MDFRLTDDQEALRAAARELLAGRFGRERLRAAVGDPALDRGLWRELGAAGFFALRLPEAAGGVGLGLPEAVLVCEEAGRALLPGPLVACHLLAGVVDGVADGERIVALADAAQGPGWWEHPDDCDELIMLEEPQGKPCGAYRTPAAEARAAAPPPPSSVDPLTPLAHLPGPSAPRTPLGAAVDVPRLRREAALLTAAQQLGSASRTVEDAVGHARTREQFGAPIGSFQAVKHLCAGMLVRAETARSAVYAAAVTESEQEVAAAKLLADEAAVRNARDCVQVHGGMGFTWEADVHLHLKRGWLRAESWGRAHVMEERLAAELLAG
ncbi:acyl-CoA dehydrogenase family protein [Streptomyces pinistramenti]|uniref:acyl-CoA dehydrogenase family protein n=1 Tax=Streptomyces pinistramenti TaxID=2884812 RepID=UPI001D0764F8|nr:acyl-CoA dehydrogenase family protein [Streptomyces pinistramenti]MCB5911716.1 acyl-CoA/acyl-ACP dehydrogenase [Streptomyces pinistramenti]